MPCPQDDNRSGFFPKECVREEPECIGALDWCQLCLAERELHFAPPPGDGDLVWAHKTTPTSSKRLPLCTRPCPHRLSVVYSIQDHAQIVRTMPTAYKTTPTSCERCLQHTRSRPRRLSAAHRTQDNAQLATHKSWAAIEVRIAHKPYLKVCFVSVSSAIRRHFKIAVVYFV